MTSRGRARRTTGVVVALLVAGLTGTASAETAAGNDEITGATPISIPGVVEDHDISGATGAASDPQTCWDGGYTVWFTAVAPETGTLRATASASFRSPEGEGGDVSAVLAVFTGQPGALVEQGCWTPRFKESALVDAPVQAGDVVYFVTGAFTSSSPRTAVTLNVRYLRAPQVDVTVDDVATVSGDGVATVTGTLRCDVDATALLSFVVRQPSREPAEIGRVEACGSELSHWSLSTLVTEGVPGLHPGRASVEGVVFAETQDLTTSVPVSTSVVLRPEHAAAH